MKMSTFRKRALRRAVSLSLLLVASASLYAQQPLSLSLNGAAEAPPVSTTATGTAQIAVRPDRTVSGSVETSGLATTVAHIHEATSRPNGPLIVTLTKTAHDGFSVPAGAKLASAQYASFLAGKRYVNVHSAAHPNGENPRALVARDRDTREARGQAVSTRTTRNGATLQDQD